MTGTLIQGCFIQISLNGCNSSKIRIELDARHRSVHHFRESKKVSFERDLHSVRFFTKILNVSRHENEITKMKAASLLRLTNENTTRREKTKWRTNC